VIVFDASTLVSAAFRREGVPAKALRHALRADRIAVSGAVLAELFGVLHRPSLARFLDARLRAELIERLLALGAVFEPEIAVADCRDAKDNKYLELALACGASAMVSSDADLLVLDPWRGVRIMRPADYLTEAGGA
jgi:putative PIN family toxin of toxin-antitoxin system